jgi:hypothetical protein
MADMRRGSRDGDRDGFPPDAAKALPAKNLHICADKIEHIDLRIPAAAQFIQNALDPAQADVRQLRPAPA